MNRVTYRGKCIFFVILLSSVVSVLGFQCVAASEPEGEGRIILVEGQNAASQQTPRVSDSALAEAGDEAKPLFSNKVRELFVEFGINQAGSLISTEPEEEDEAGQAKIRAYQEYLRGAWLFEKGLYKEALTHFEEASSDDPGSLHIRYSIARSYLHLGELDKVLEVCDAILERAPEAADALILKAETFAMMDNYRKAQELYEQVLKTEPGNVRALEALGKIYFKVQGNLDKTISVYEQILLTNPKDLYALVILSSVYALKGDVDKSLTYYDRILQLQPVLLNKLVQMGELLEEHQNYEGALKVYRRVLVYDPKNPLALQNFARLVLKLKGQDGLLAAYKELAEEYPMAVELQELYANQLMEMGRYEEANKQFSVVQALSEGNARVPIEQAKIALAEHKEDAAAAALQKALDLGMNEVDAYTELGLFCQKQKAYAQAASYFEHATELAPKNPVLIVHLIRIYDQLQAYDKMEALIKKSVAENETSDLLYAELGKFYKDQKKTQAAIEAYQKAIALNPTKLAYVWALVEIYLQTNRLDELQTFIQDNEQHFEKDAKQFDMLIASLYSGYGKFSRALPYFQKALAIDPTDLTVYGYISATYNQLHQYDKAIEILEQARTALGDKAQSVEYDMLLATAYTDQRKYEQAVELYEKILERSPADIDAYRSITFCLNKQGKYKKALEYVEKAERAIGKDNPAVADFRAQALADQKQYDEAAAVYQGLIDHDKTNDHYYFLLGQVYYEAKRFTEAEAAFRKAIELNENNVDAYNNLGYMFAENNMHLDEAQKLIEKALELRPYAGYIIDSLGWVYFQKRDMDKALELLEKAASLSGDDPVMLDHLGDVYRAKGENHKALEYWKRAIEIDPSMTDVKKKIDEIKE